MFLHVVGWDPYGQPIVGGSAYGDALTRVGLHPDNPDGMYAALADFLAHPQAYKNRDPHWPGTRDDLSWWEEPKGKAKLMWPFGGGAWLDACPKNDAQVRAVFKIPANVKTGVGLSKAYSHGGKPGFPSGWAYSFKHDGWSAPSGGFDLGNVVHQAVQAAQHGLGSVVDVANTLRIPGVNLTTALLTGKNLGDALKQDVSNFASAANLAKSVSSGDFGAVAKDLTGQAAKLGINLPPQAVQAAVAAAASGKSPQDIATTALGSHYEDAWNVATHFGSIASSLPPPPGSVYHPQALPAAAHPLTQVAKAIPLPVALAATPLEVPVHAPTVERVLEQALTEGFPMTDVAAAAFHVVGSRHGR